MKKKLVKIVFTAEIIFTIFFVFGAFSWKFLGPDNKIEEICEDIIEDQTGIDIDISIGTPEN